MKEDKSIIENLEIKLNKQGAVSLSDEELMALIIRKGDSTKNVLELSSNVLRRYGGKINDLIGITKEELLGDNPGMTQQKAVMLLCCLELGTRAYLKKEEVNYIFTSQDVLNLLGYDMAYSNQEHFYVILLNTKNMIIYTILVSIGTINASLVHAREVFRNAIKKSANSVILVHNHPSGNAFPSMEDRDLTNRMKDVGQLVGIQVIDHIIMAKDNYFSFMEENMI